MPQAPDLTPLFSPRSIAVIGASDDPRKWGNWLARGALRGEDRREVHLVNHRSKVVLGRTAYRSASEIPGGVELAVVTVPAPSFGAAVDDALAAGARAIVGISAGLGETGPEGERLQAEIVARVRAAGAVLLGPNCLGLLDAGSKLYLTSNDFPAGPIGLISQSGNLALELAAKAEEAGLGFARFVSVGNQADLDVADLVAAFTESPSIEVIALYCEDFRDGRSFLSAAAAAGAKGKPVVLLTVGTSQAAARAARSHTGALVSGALSIDAACDAAGIERVATPQQLVDLVEGLLLGAKPAGRRVGVLADGGGHGALAADVVEAAGLSVPPFSVGLASQLSGLIGTTGGTGNPVDLAGAGEQDIWSFERAVGALLDSPELDAVVVTGYFGDYGAYGDELARNEQEVADALAKLVTASDKPVVFHSMHQVTPADADPSGAREALRRLRRAHVPLYPTIEQAASVLAGLVRRGTRPPTGVPALPAPVEAPATAGYFAARELLAAAGVRFAPARRIADVGELRSAAEELGFPVALKAPAIEHKSDAGGVVLNIADLASLESAAAELWRRLGPDALSLEQMVPTSGGVELLVGARCDPRFGPVAVAGLGGIYTEVLSDVAAALAPIDEDVAERLIRSLKGSPLLTGARGRATLDVAAAARALAAISRVAASRPLIAEIEVNPLVVLEEGVYGLDARLVLSGSPSGEPAS